MSQPLKSLKCKSKNESYLSNISLTFSLPDNFGEGWDYCLQHLYATHHQWAGSYNKSSNENFAHEALSRLEGVTNTSFYVGTSCSVSFDVSSVDEATAIQNRLKEVVDAFPARAERNISVRGSNFYDQVVTEYDSQLDVDASMPFMKYLALHVPMATKNHPALSGIDIFALIA